MPISNYLDLVPLIPYIVVYDAIYCGQKRTPKIAFFSDMAIVGVDLYV